MGELLFQAGGALLGSAIPGVGWFMGAAIGGLVGNAYNIIRMSNQKISAGEVGDLKVGTAASGTPVPFTIGRDRLPAIVLWARDVEYSSSFESQGKKGSPKVENRAFYLTCAICFNGNEISSVRRVWADAHVVYDDRPEQPGYSGPKYEPGWEDVFEFFLGTQTQMPSSLIESFEGVGNVPGFRGLAYMTLNRANITRFGGSRPPQFWIEFETDDGEVNLALIFDTTAELVEIAAGDRDFTDLAGITVPGFTISDTDPVIEHWGRLCDLYAVDVLSRDGKTIGQLKGQASSLTIDANHLGATLGFYPPEDKAKIAVTETQDARTLPNICVIRYLSEAAGFAQFPQVFTRDYGLDTRIPLVLDFPYVTTEQQAADAAVIKANEIYLQRTSATIMLPMRYFSIAPGDVVTVPTNIGNLTMKVVDIRLKDWILTIKLLEDAPYIYEFTGNPVIPDYEATTDDPGDVVGDYIETHCVRDADVAAQYPTRSWSLYLYGGSTGTNPFAGIKAWTKEPTGVVQTTYGASFAGAGFYVYQLLDIGIDSAVFGEAITELSGTADHRFWDYENEVDVELLVGSLTSAASKLEVLNGKNWAIIGNEIIGFLTATALGGGQYRLSTLLRGLRGTDWAMSGHGAVGEKFVLITPGSSLRQSIFLTNPTTFDYDVCDPRIDPSSLTTTRSFTAIGASGKCYSPTLLANDNLYAGGSEVDIELSWVRRPKSNNGLVDGSEPPLDESTESYRVTILESDVVIRTVTVSTPAYTYTAAQQIADFGGADVDPVFRVQQIGYMGLGWPAEKSLV